MVGFVTMCYSLCTSYHGIRFIWLSYFTAPMLVCGYIMLHKMINNQTLCTSLLVASNDKIKWKVWLEYISACKSIILGYHICIEQHGILPKEISHPILHDVALAGLTLPAQPNSFHSSPFSCFQVCPPHPQYDSQDLKSRFSYGPWTSTRWWVWY